MKALSEPAISSTRELKITIQPSEKLSHQEIVRGLKEGDESVLGYLYSQHVHDLFRFGSQISQDKEIVKDCIQDIFLTLIRRSISINKIGSIKSYLYKSLYRAIIEKLRRRQKYLLDPRCNNLEGFEIEISNETRIVNEEAYRLKVAKVNEQLKRLTKKQKQAILLYYYDGLSHKEIAELMNLGNKHLVTKLIRRGLDTIRKNVSVTLLIFLKILIP